MQRNQSRYAQIFMILVASATGPGPNVLATTFPGLCGCAVRSTHPGHVADPNPFPGLLRNFLKTIFVSFRAEVPNLGYMYS